MAGFPYEQSEPKWRELRRGPYGDWVAKNFDWKLWGGPWSNFGGWKFRIAVMGIAPGDPERLERKARQEKYGGLEGLYEHIRRSKHVTPDEYERVILKHLADGRPRTLNRITVELLDTNAEAIPHAMLLALQRLVYSRELAFATVSPGGDPDAYHFVLFWNDATWRKRHPQYEKHRHPPGFAQMEVLPLERAVLPTERLT